MIRRQKQATHTWRRTITTSVAAGATITMGKIDVRWYRRIVGMVAQDTAATGTLTVTFTNDGNAGQVALYTVPIDATQTWGSVYSYDIIVLAPYVEITWVNGGTIASFFRAFNQAVVV